ncbi:TRAP transporter permease [Lipingzhangella sp. LS1_29]|uniref:TRAP transporter permease n=1 Tax=Lipingzhangella rawalii TaxID=2055835 RepID=A0ABU2H6V5_9ACTN|nr:TRAP transporter permease [Lipingzhangella rawalii]MDS1270585.1 TRAP transporter permease [Lipingzhangella rawalii]
MTEVDDNHRPPTTGDGAHGPPSPTTVQAEDSGNRPLWTQLGHERWGSGTSGSAMAIVVLALSVAFCGYQLSVAVGGLDLFGVIQVPNLDAYRMRVYHLAFVLALVFLIRPAGRGSWARSWPMGVTDLVLVTTALIVGVYPAINFEAILQRVGQPTGIDLLMGALLLVLLLEACRRTIGLFMSLLAVTFLVYAWIGPLLPGELRHDGFTYQRIVAHSYLNLEGVYGIALGVAATFVFIFVFFGALLQKTGGGNFFIGLAYALTGRYAGGPAKGAVVGSALMGSISGSAIANTVTTGAFTIPLMKRVGYRRHEAGGVEAAASTGGQVLPPIMGAGAFVMAEFTGIPYTDILKVAIIPAIMYFVVVFLFVDLIARKRGIHGLGAKDLPGLVTTLRDGWHFLVPFVFLVTLLLNYVTPLRAGLYASVVLLGVAMLRAATRLNLTQLAEVFVLAARNTVAVSIACATAGIIVGMVTLTGVGLKVTGFILGAGGGVLLLTLAMVALASLVLGMGLPVTAAYIVLSVLAVPALQELGVGLLVAHMIVYWYSNTSNVTPPVALAAFSASGIAGSNPMRTAVAALQFAGGLYLIPVLMAYGPLLLNGPLPLVLWTVLTGCVALFAAVVALTGFLFTRTLIVERIAFAGAAVLTFVPVWWTQAAGVTLILLLTGVQLLLWRASIRTRGTGDTPNHTSPPPTHHRRREHQ